MSINERQRHHRRRRRKKKEKRAGKIITNIFLGIAILVFCYSAVQIWSIYSEYNKGEKEYDGLQQLVTQEVEKENGDGEEDTSFSIDFMTLKDINPDIVAWIRFDEPKEINYPIVQGSDNDKYIDTSFRGEKNKAGAIFMEVRNHSDFTDRNTFIYGHNMKNGTMFAELMKYRDREYHRENPYFYIYTPDGREIKYEIFSASVVNDDADSYIIQYNSDEEFLNYLDIIKQASGYATGVSVSVDSKIVSLSTCTNRVDVERFLVHGVKIEEKMVEK